MEIWGEQTPAIHFSPVLKGNRDAYSEREDLLPRSSHGIENDAASGWASNGRLWKSRVPFSRTLRRTICFPENDEKDTHDSKERLIDESRNGHVNPCPPPPCSAFISSREEWMPLAASGSFRSPSACPTPAFFFNSNFRNMQKLQSKNRRYKSQYLNFKMR